MRDEQKTKEELLRELKALRIDLEQSEQAEHGKSNKGLKESGQIFKTIFENAADGILLADVESKKFYMGNNIICQMLGIDKKEIDALGVMDIHPEQDLPYVVEQFDKQTRGEITLAKDIPVKRKNGSVLFTDVNAFPIKLDGKTYLMGIFRDVSERKQAEKELRDSKYLLEKMFSSLNSAVFVLDNGTPPCIVDCNPAALSIFGHQKNQLVGQTTDILHVNADSLLEFQKTLYSAIETHGHLSSFEFRMKRKDGQIFPTEHYICPLKNDMGDRIGWVSVVNDITERKKAENALKQSEEKFRLAMESTNDALWDWDIVTNEVYRNPRHATMLGYEPNELTASQKEWENRIHPEDKQTVFQILDEYFAGKRDSFEIEYRLRAKSGDYVWVLGRGKVVACDDDGSPTRMIGTNIDITERKRAEEANAEYQTLIQGIMDNAGSIVVVRDLQGHYLLVNREVEKVLGLESKQIIGNTPYDIHSYDKAKKILTDDKIVIESRNLLEIEDHLDAQGENRIFLGTKFPLQNVSGEIYAVCTVATDITEQRNMQRALAESEEKYRTLIECAGDPISTINDKGVLLFANKVAAETLRYQPEDLVGKTLWDLFPKNIADRLAADVQKAIKTGQRINTVSLIEINEQSRWYHNTLEPLRDDCGRATAVMIIARDVDNMKRAEEQIQKLSSAVESSINGIAIGDAKGNLTYANPALLEMWGYDHENEVLGRNAADFWQTRDEGQKILETVINKGSWIGEMTALKKDGSTFDVQVCATLVKDENDKPISMMGSFVDISEMKRKEEELTSYRGQMARAEQLASLGTLSATIAHQLTQPLTVIRLSMDNALDELQASSSSDTVIRRLKESVTQVSNITSIIENFRNFARKSSGRTVAEVNLKVVAVRIARLLSESARSANVILRIRNMDDLPCPWMNENDLEQLFFALTENAIQAADGKKTRQLVISGAVKDEHIELRVCDDCGGIAPENIDKIFEPFFTTKPRGQGTGLGLCIVKDVISRNGGHVRAESEFGKGTTFIINLPFEKNNIMSK